MVNVSEKRTQAMEYATQADALLGAGNIAGAMDYYHKAIQTDPGYIDAYISLGHVYVGQDQFQEARTQYTHAIELDKKCAEAYFHLGNVSLLENNYQDAVHQYTLAVGNGDTDAQLYFNQGLAYEGIGNGEMALRSYARAIRSNPDQPAYRIKMAQLQIENFHLDGAEETLAECLRLYPDVFEGYHYMYILKMRAGKEDEAEAFLTQALERFSEDAALTSDLVNLYVHKREFDKALEAIDRALKMPGNEGSRRSLLFARAKVFMMTQRRDEGFEIMEQLRQTEDGEMDMDLRFYLMSMQMADKRFDGLLTNAHEVAEQGGEGRTYYAALYFEGYATEMLKGKEEAKLVYTRAVRKLRTVTLKDGRALDAYVYRAMCLRGLEEYDKALELLDYVLRIGGDAQLEVHALKGLIYHDMNDPKNEKAELKRLEDKTKALGEKYHISLRG